MSNLRYFNLSPATLCPSPPGHFMPAHFLAAEEALLDFCEASDHPGFLAFWESPEYFVVLGYGKKSRDEVYADRCRDLRIPILRRTSGGGTVLQGPGCFNYSLVCPIDSSSAFESITSTNRFVMEQTRSALAPHASGELTVQGHTDLTIDGLKFSGNAQRRKRRCLLFHGSFLVQFDLDIISQTLRPPPQQPEYRQNRPHHEFITNLRLPTQTIETSLVKAWHATPQNDPALNMEISRRAANLVADKYSRSDWNERF